MNLPESDFAARRALLSDEISRQRGELARAYDNLEAPIRYTEYGMRGFGLIRSNPWIVAAVPVVYGVVTNLFSGKKKTPSQSQAIPGSAEAGRLTKAKNVVATGIGHGWRLYQLYRRVRTYLP